FHQIIVGADVETSHPVFNRIPRGQEEHGGSYATFPERSQDFESIVPRQHHIEDYQVERLSLDQVKALLARVGNTHRVVVCFESLAYGLGHFLLVLDDENVHASFIWPERSQSQPKGS